MRPFRVHIPATSANLGPGFDSIGIALSKYVTLECTASEEWHFIVPEKDQPYIPSGKENLIYKSAIYTAQSQGHSSLPPCAVKLSNDVPIARGLGSSSTAVVGGIELADHLLQLNLTDFEKLKIACAIEGHPDNVAPAIYGGIMIASYDGGEVDFVRFTEGLENLTWLAIVPDFHLETEKARQLLPRELPYKQAVHASGTANVLVAALAQQNWELAGKMMMHDEWHQPYRKQLIPGFDDVLKTVDQFGASGLYISGAGPTMVALFDQFSDSAFEKIESQLPEYKHFSLRADLVGVHTEPASISQQ
ncbi:homoserine kinase [Halobacillus locisalis]|uniref:Homoserine kinase n=1 Tax=Halobacillus locisalis TaxID=220753 RepID=A0A838CUD0_9BACI|nr:homoserine kinase [Halobacillus locisalis]MBA2175531.1 homoserine kinase [Halobacillus locisalis]